MKSRDLKALSTPLDILSTTDSGAVGESLLWFAVPSNPGAFASNSIFGRTEPKGSPAVIGNHLVFGRLNTVWIRIFPCRRSRWNGALLLGPHPVPFDLQYGKAGCGCSVNGHPGSRLRRHHIDDPRLCLVPSIVEGCRSFHLCAIARVAHICLRNRLRTEASYVGRKTYVT